MSDSGPGRREVAYRLFAAEFDDAEFSYSESDEERAPNYVVTPTGARANRLFAVGVLTEVEDVNPEMVRGRVVDPTGAFVTYAGQYQPEALAFLERADPPSFIALSGKARTFEPDDGDQIYTSVRPESVSEVDAETRDRAAVVAAERTLERVGVMASALESGLEGDRLRAALEEAGVDERLADGVALALEYYGTTPAYLEALRELALDVARVVAGEREEVRSLDASPGEGTGDAAPLASLDLSEVSIPEPASTPDAESTADAETAATATDLGEQEASDSAASDTDASATDDGDRDADDQVEATSSSPTPGSPTTSDPDVETDTGTDTGSRAATGAEPDETSTETAEPDSGAVSGTDPAPTDADESAPEGTPESGAGTGPSDQQADEPGAEQADEPAAEQTDEPTAEQADEPGAEQADEPGAEQADEPAAEQTDEPTAEPDEGFATDDLGTEAVDEPGDFEPGEFELDEEERREVEEEHGTEFSTADEIEDADVGSPEPEVEPDAEPEPEAGPGPDAGAEPDSEGATGPAAESEPEAEPDADTEPVTGGGDETEEGGDAAGDVNLEDAVVQTMEEQDDGDGADREEVVASVVDEYGADPDAVEDAVQDALMSGRCYEPSDGTLKSI